MVIIYRQNMDKIEGKLFRPTMINWTFNKDEAEILLKRYEEWFDTIVENVSVHFFLI